MIKGLMLLGDGFEQVEALGTQDILNRTREIIVDCVSISEKYEVLTSSGLTIKTTKLLKDIDPSIYDFIVLPGGKVGVDNLKASELVKYTIMNFYESNKYMFAICAAPSVYESMGLLDGKQFTCFPSFECGRGQYTGEGVTKCGKFITGRSMGFTIPFSKEIVKELLGEEALNKIYPGVYGLDK